MVSDTDIDHDAISALVDCAVPEKLAAFQQTLLDFMNRHLGKLNLTVSNLETEASPAHRGRFGSIYIVALPALKNNTIMKVGQITYFLFVFLVRPDHIWSGNLTTRSQLP